MEVKAQLNSYRVSPRKARLVVDLVRNKPIKEALIILSNTQKRVAKPIKKLLNSAINNAVANDGLTVEQLYIKKIFVDEGKTLKRAISSWRGQQKPILKRMSHITIILSNVRIGGKK